MANEQKNNVSIGMTAAGGILGATGGTVIIHGVITAVAVEGTVGAAAITSGLAALGGSMVGGIITVAALPLVGAVVLGGMFYGLNKLYESEGL